MKNISIYHTDLLLKSFGSLKYKDIASNKTNHVYDEDGNKMDIFDQITYSKSLIDQRHEHLKCPAVTEWYKNTWIIHQPFDIKLIYHSKEHKIDTNANQLFDLRPVRKSSEHNLIEDHTIPSEDINFFPEAQFHAGYLFWTKANNTWIEMLPHPESIKLGLELTPATYAISSWTRPTTFAFIIKKKDVIIDVPRGTPLYYVRFISKKYYNINVTLEKKQLPMNIFLKSYFDTNLKYLIPWYSWKLMQKRLKNEDKYQKCPFFNLFDKTDKDDKIII